jgi:hypothetical protein
VLQNGLMPNVDTLLSELFLVPVAWGAGLAATDAVASLRPPLFGGHWGTPFWVMETVLEPW